MMNSTGLIYIFTGDGKGKTSAALGVAMRAIGHGKRVVMIQWYKERRWKIGEHKLPELLKTKLFEIYPMGQGFYQLPTDHATSDEHKKAAEEAMELGRKLLQKESVKMVKIVKKLSTPYHHNNLYNPDHLFLLILDEVLNAIHDGLISKMSLIRLIAKRQATHIILTGRNAPKELIEIADLVTEMKNIKHPYDSGKKAVLGLDF